MSNQEKINHYLLELWATTLTKSQYSYRIKCIRELIAQLEKQAYAKGSIMTNKSIDDDWLEKILNEKPDLVPPPDGLWESIRATWTGLWTDWHGSLNELQASDVFPIADFLSDERKEWFKAALEAHIAEAVRLARIDERQFAWDLVNAVRYQNKTLDEAKHVTLERLSDLQVEQELAEELSNKRGVEDE